VTVSVKLSRGSAKALEKLFRGDRRVYERVSRALDRLAEEPELGKPLQGPLAGRRSHRVGALRIIYRFEAERLLILILDIGTHGKIYR
jgi:mRNA-degrading endonuclease RelE of RelBE toxin-antitoxin system